MLRYRTLELLGITTHAYYYQPKEGKRGSKKPVYTVKLTRMAGLEKEYLTINFRVMGPRRSIRQHENNEQLNQITNFEKIV